MGDTYRPREQRSYYDDRPRHDYFDDRHERRPDSRSRNVDGRSTAPDYRFMGAAAERDHHRPQDDFNFRSGGPPAPLFPPIHRHDYQPPPQRRTHEDVRHREQERAPPGRGRGAHNGPSRGVASRGRGARPAHTRAILQSDTERATTPEQFEGMNLNGEIRFKEAVSSESGGSEAEGDDVVDLTRDSDENIDYGTSRKRVKTEATGPTPVPKWSNPDPYTVLPPPETLGAPKKDIVQVIRKAKVDVAATKSIGKNAVTENDDFISFNFDDDVPAESVSASTSPRSHSPRGAPISHERHVPTGPAESHGLLPNPPVQDLDNGHMLPSVAYVPPMDEGATEHLLSGARSHKRKRADDKDRQDGDVLDEWQVGRSNPTPWCEEDHSGTSSTGLRLHKEICDFNHFVRPYDYEEAVRHDIIARIQRAIQDMNPGGSAAIVHSFGSFAARLYLPTADMDLVIVSSEYMRYGQRTFCQTGTQMHRLGRHLIACGVAMTGGMSVINKARVPIIKFVDKVTGIKVDISFENNSGLIANETFRAWKNQYPAMPVVVVLIKQMLAMRGLNEVYLGGIGGFTIICLVVSMMQHMPEMQAGRFDARQNYGDLLLNFLDLYGNKFDFRATGIVMHPPGYYDKNKKPRVNQNHDRLTIIDPNREDNDISGGSSRINVVFNCFRHAHAQLQRRLAAVQRGQNVKDSLLGCVWGGNYSSFIYQREKLEMLNRGYAVSPPPSPAPQQAARRSKPPKPGPATAGRSIPHRLPPKPTAAPASHETSNGANGNPEEHVGPTVSKRKKNRENLAALRERKTKQFKLQHPEHKNAPDRLTKGQMKKLLAKAAPVGSGKAKAKAKAKG